MSLIVLLLIFQKNMASTSQSIFNLQNPADVAAIHDILLTEDDILLREDNGDKEDTDTEEVIQERNEDSETDQDAESSDDEGPSLEFFWTKTKLLSG